METKDIQIPFGAQDSELKGWEYTIPEGMEAIIKDGKVIVREKDKENKDERIRKAALEGIEYLEHNLGWDYIGNTDILDVKEYLERQKDSKVVKFDHDREQKPVEWIEDIIKKAVKEVGLTQHQVDWFKTNVFPPKQEWSKEDEENINTLIEVIHERMGLSEKRKQYYEKWLKSKSLRHQPNLEWTEEDKRKLNRIYEILGYAADDKGFLTSKRIIGDNEAVELQDFLKSLRPQPKQGWSDKDKAMLKVAIAVLRRYGHDDVADWLKSLRPQPHWKPSEEQMEALERASTNEYLSARQYDILVSLYEQLTTL